MRGGGGGGDELCSRARAHRERPVTEVQDVQSRVFTEGPVQLPWDVLKALKRPHCTEGVKGNGLVQGVHSTCLVGG